MPCHTQLIGHTPKVAADDVGVSEGHRRVAQLRSSAAASQAEAELQTRRADDAHAVKEAAIAAVAKVEADGAAAHSLRLQKQARARASLIPPSCFLPSIPPPPPPFAGHVRALLSSEKRAGSLARRWMPRAAGGAPLRRACARRWRSRRGWRASCTRSRPSGRRPSLCAVSLLRRAGQYAQEGGRGRVDWGMLCSF